jgi:HPt (histidine-containing phosphotransfer) domain-containing protein
VISLKNLITDRTLVLIVTGDPDSWRRRVRETDIVRIVGKPLGRKELVEIMETNFGSVDPVRLGRLRALGETAMQQLFEAFGKGLPGMLSTIDEALTKGDPDSVYQAAHRLKGSAATLGLSEIERCAGGLEASAQKSETWSGWRAKLKRAVGKLDLDAVVDGGEGHASRRTQIAISN